jgi:ATP-dependent RNA helicase DeaD
VSRLLVRLQHYGPASARSVARHEPSPPVRDGWRRGDARSKAHFVPFRINWGQQKGADPRRLLALVCRRGGIRGGDVGAIEIGPRASTFEVMANVAAAFAASARKPDTRDAGVRIERFDPRHANPEKRAAKSRTPVATYGR